MNQKEFMKNVEEWSDICLNDEKIDLEAYDRFEVKRGLRDKSGDGVVAGLTKVSKILSNRTVDGEKVPCEGQLFYRGYNIHDLVNGVVREALVLRKLPTSFFLEICQTKASWSTLPKLWATAGLCLQILSEMWS